MIKKGVPHVILKEDKAAIKSANTHIASAFVICGGRLEQNTLGESVGFQDTITKDINGNPKRTCLWVLESMTLDFIGQESLTTQQFVKNWFDLEWQNKNLDHPLTYLASYQRQLSYFRDKINKDGPLIVIKKGKSTATIPSIKNDKGDWIPDPKHSDILKYL